MIKPKKKKTTREPKPREFPDNPVPRPEIDPTPLPHNKIRDLRGLTFAHLFVYGYSRTRQMANGHMDVYWNCWCDCGTLCEVTRRGLVVRKTQSCGCTTQVGRKGVLANQVTQLKRSEMTKRIKMGLPPVPPTIVDGDPAVAFAHDSLLSYACLQWDKYIPAAHHRLVAHYLERVERGEIKRLMIFMPPRAGKMCADSTPVMTTDGWKTHGELKVGDFVYSLNGLPVAILEVSEKLPVANRVTFSNGESIQCHENHEWGVIFYSPMHGKKIYRVIETNQIKKGLAFGIEYGLPESPVTLSKDPVEIVLIQECPPEPGQCIQVDSDDGLYLVGKSFIPTHNSMLVSEFFPAWFLGRNPDKRVIAASYGQELASDFGRKVRNQIADPLFQEIFPEAKLSDDSAAADKFNLAAPKTGGYFAVGVGGALTGRGANCLPGDTKILTSHGIVDISDILRYNTPLMALSFSEKDAAFIWSPIVAVSRRKTNELVRVVTDRGSIVCTPEHPFYIEGTGYVEAKALTKGQGLCVYGMSPLRKGISERSTSNRESDGAREELEFLLFWDMQTRTSEKRSNGSQRINANENLLNVSKRIQTKTGKRVHREVLLKDMCVPPYRGGDVKRANNSGLQILWKRLSCKEQHKHSLFEGMCRQNPLGENDWKEQSELSGWVGDRQGRDEKDDSRDFGERWVAVCCLPRNEKSPYPSYRPQSGKQCNGEYGDSLSIMSYAGTQDRRKASVCMVEPICNGLVEVYDIEVFEHHNFVVLDNQGTPLVVKNCLIIDDPVKSREESDSEASRRRIKDWYTAVAYTRLMDNGSIVICQTRWNLEDLSGWLLKEHRHENWIVLNLPAINEKGEALWPERFPLEILESIKRTLPARDWFSLYQQKPFIEEGEIFRRGWWKKWPDSKPLPECSYVIQSWDTAFTEQDIKANSFSARTTWGVFQRPDEDYANVILLERWKGQVDYASLRKEALSAFKEYQPDKVIIEKKASGISLVQDLRKAGLPIHAFNPEKDKIARAYRAQSLFENGRVYYPDRKWAEDVIDEMCTFRPGNPNDTADTISQAFIWLTNSWLVRNSADVDADEDDLPDNVKRFKPRRHGYA